MSAADAARRVADQFDEAEIPYAIGGALALGVWGAPRNTIDVDISAFVSEAELPTVLDALERAGVMIDRAAAPGEIARIGLVRGRLGRTPIDVFLSSHPHVASMLARRRQITDPDGSARWFLAPEDLVILKLFYGRPKDLLDLDRLVRVQTELDFAYVREWIEKMVPAGDRRLAALDGLAATPRSSS